MKLNTFGNYSVPCSDESCSQILDYCYEQANGECNTTKTNTIWVKIPSIPQGYSYIYLCNVTPSPKNGTDVFDFYEDWNSYENRTYNPGEYIGGKWYVWDREDKTGGEFPTIKDGELYMSCGGFDIHRVVYKDFLELTSDIWIELSARFWDAPWGLCNGCEVIYFNSTLEDFSSICSGGNQNCEMDGFCHRNLLKIFYNSSGNYGAIDLFSVIGSYSSNFSCKCFDCDISGIKIGNGTFSIKLSSILGFVPDDIQPFLEIYCGRSSNEANVWGKQWIDWIRFRKAADKDPEIVCRLSANTTAYSSNRSFSINVSCVDHCDKIYYALIDSSEDCNETSYSLYVGKSALINVTSGGNFSICAFAQDSNGVNYSVYRFGPYILDDNPPTTISIPSSGNYTAPLEISLDCSDDLMGCKETYYRVIPFEETCPSNISLYHQGNSVLLQEGIWRLCYFSVDKLGNLENVKEAVYNLSYVNKTLYLKPYPMIVSKYNFSFRRIDFYADFDLPFGFIFDYLNDTSYKMIYLSDGYLYLLECNNNCISRAYSKLPAISNEISVSCDPFFISIGGHKYLLGFTSCSGYRIGFYCKRCRIGPLAILR